MQTTNKPQKDFCQSPHPRTSTAKPNRRSGVLTGAILLTTGLLLGGCTYIKHGFTQPYGGGQAKIVPLGTLDRNLLQQTNRLAAWSYYDAMYRAGYLIMDGTNRFIALAESPPDAAVSLISRIKLDAKLNDKTANAMKELQTTVEKLGERSVGVNMLRDGSYRISELSVNGKIEKAEITNMFANLLTTVQAVEKARAEHAVASGVNANLATYLSLCEKHKLQPDPHAVLALAGVPPQSLQVIVTNAPPITAQKSKTTPNRQTNLVTLITSVATTTNGAADLATLTNSVSVSNVIYLTSGALAANSTSLTAFVAQIHVPATNSQARQSFTNSVVLPLK